MSKEINTYVNINSVVKRARELAGVAANKDLAKYLGLSAQNFSAKKNRGTLLPILLELAINKNVDLHEFITGSHLGGKKPPPNSQTVPSTSATFTDRADNILNSDNHDAIGALKQSIKHLENTIEKEKKQQEENETIRKELAELKKQKCKDEKHCPGEPSQDEKAA